MVLAWAPLLSPCDGSSEGFPVLVMVRGGCLYVRPLCHHLLAGGGWLLSVCLAYCLVGWWTGYLSLLPPQRD